MAASDHRIATAREDLCRFLAACYYEPGPEFAEERIFDSLREAAGTVQPGLAPIATRIGEAFAAEGPEDLLVEYTRLFLGPVQPVARPYGSVWLRGGGERPDPAPEVLSFYEEGGFEIAEDFRELPDHVAAELEFLYLLLFRENPARRAAEPAASPIAADLRRRFLAEHLGAWIGPFSAAIRNGTRSAFYRELAELTERFVRLEEGRDGSR